MLRKHSRPVQAHRRGRPEKATKNIDGRRSNSIAAAKPRLSQLSERSYVARNRALEVLSLVREGKSVTSAVRIAHTSRANVLHYLPGDFHKPRGKNRYVPSKSDRHVRLINLILSDGKEYSLHVRGSRQAKLASDYSNAFQRYKAGDRLALRPFRGKKVAGHTLLTNPKKIKELGEKGVEVDHFYAEVFA